MRSTRRTSRARLRTALLAALLVVAAAVIPGSAAVAGPKPAPKPTIVLVHGAWADASSWSGVTSRLQHDGYTVAAVPDPLRGVASDATYVSSYLATITGPIVLVAHSYGGFVITNAALGNANVKALVYVDAYIPAAGDSLLSLTAHDPGSMVSEAALDFVPLDVNRTVIDTYIKPDLFPKIFANDLPASQGAQLAATQRPLLASALGEASGTPAWTGIPSWALIGTLDNVIPPATQRFMATRAGSRITTVRASHLSMISKPDAVEGMIRAAAKSS